MTAGMIGLIIILVLILAIMGTGYYAYRKIKKKIGDFALRALGTSDVMKGLKSVEAEYENTPKSVSGGTSLYLPQINRDFPDFHYVEMKRRAENVLTSYLRSVDKLDASLLTEGLDELKDKLKMRINMLQDVGKTEHFENIRIHRTEISSYRKARGRCSITFQTSLQYSYWVEQNGQVLQGARNKLHQSRYEVELIYIQDRDLVENTKDAGLAMNCPNCGAPLPTLGAKKCAFCDTPIMEFSVRTWNFSDVQEKV